MIYLSLLFHALHDNYYQIEHSHYCYDITPRIKNYVTTTLQMNAHALHLWHGLLSILTLHFTLQLDLLLNILLIHNFLLFSFAFFLTF